MKKNFSNFQIWDLTYFVSTVHISSQQFPHRKIAPDQSLNNSFNYSLQKSFLNNLKGQGK